ncbi:mechanosensitive ion channel family protein [Caldicellulosiruptor acetigenus]|uniref:mechanosensitive ion channel family protein n=1 Tax=Caldicellulosiruptor acetigenus TaxID=301953 RepID=UPI0004A3D35E|nr:mechanosensitive ion channel family protein [Caldicellulosiruptor acetigenus]WAM35748.1 mechanosensitive ion channel family protein [Caldicellulosiruptor acetigenus]
MCLSIGKLSEIILKYSGKIIYSIVILVIGFLFLKFSNKILEKWKRKQRNSVFPINQKRIDTLAALFKSIIKYSIYFLVIVLILENFNVSIKTILAVAGIGGLAIGFGAQSLIKDVIAGLFLIIEDQLSVGDYVTIDGRSGTVKEMGIKTIKIQDYNGSIHIIPNGSIGAITNWSRHNSKAIVDVKLNTKMNFDEVSLKLQEVFKEIEEEFKEDIVTPPQIVGIVDTNWIEYTLRIVTETKPLRHWDLERAMRKKIIEKLFVS